MTRKILKSYCVQVFDQDEDGWDTMDSNLSLKGAIAKGIEYEGLEGMGNVRVTGMAGGYVYWPETQRWFVDVPNPSRVQKAVKWLNGLDEVNDSVGVRPKWKYGIRQYLIRIDPATGVTELWEVDHAGVVKPVPFTPEKSGFTHKLSVKRYVEQ